MSISLRKFRARIFEYRDAGSAGEVDSTYLIKASTAADQCWWCSRAEGMGRETTIGMQPDHREETTFVFSAHCPIAMDDAIIVDGKSYKVSGTGDRDYGHDEIQVQGYRIVELALTQT